MQIPSSTSLWRIALGVFIGNIICALLGVVLSVCAQFALVALAGSSGLGR